MRVFSPNAPTVAGSRPGARVPPSTARRGGWGIPGVWSALLGLAALLLLGALAPGGPLATRASSLLPGFRPAWLLASAAMLGALGALSGIRHLWRGGPATSAALGLGLSLCPLLIASALLVARLFVAAP